MTPDQAVLLAWPIVVALLYRFAGGPRAVLVAVIGGFLFLPPGQFKIDLGGFGFPIDKWNIIGIALIASLLLLDRTALRGFRPHWWDLPLIAWYLERAPTGSAYGAAGALVLMMLWVYYAAIILFAGAVVTATIDERRGVLPGQP